MIIFHPKIAIIVHPCKILQIIRKFIISRPSTKNYITDHLIALGCHQITSICDPKLLEVDKNLEFLLLLGGLDLIEANLC